jgi:hypothetical protein
MESYPPDHVRALESSSLDMFKALFSLEQERNDNESANSIMVTSSIQEKSRASLHQLDD